jgi:uncharacterized membrane protein
MPKCARCGHRNTTGDSRCAGCGAPLSTALRPGVGSSYEQVGRAVRANWATLLKALVMTMVLGAAGNVFEVAGAPNPWTDFGAGGVVLILGYIVLISYPMGYGVAFAGLKALRGERPRFMDLFAGFRNYPNVIFSILASAALIMAGTVFLVVPGIWVTCRLAFTPLLVVDRGMGAVAAVKESWRMTKGYGWSVLGIAMVAFTVTVVVELALTFATNAPLNSVGGVVIQTVTAAVMLMMVWFAVAALYNKVAAGKDRPPIA